MRLFIVIKSWLNGVHYSIDIVSQLTIGFYFALIYEIGWCSINTWGNITLLKFNCFLRGRAYVPYSFTKPCLMHPVIFWSREWTKVKLLQFKNIYRTPQKIVVFGLSFPSVIKITHAFPHTNVFQWCDVINVHPKYTSKFPCNRDLSQKNLRQI